MLEPLTCLWAHPSRHFHMRRRCRSQMPACQVGLAFTQQLLFTRQAEPPQPGAALSGRRPVLQLSLRLG